MEGWRNSWLGGWVGGKMGPRRGTACLRCGEQWEILAWEAEVEVAPEEVVAVCMQEKLAVEPGL